MSDLSKLATSLWSRLEVIIPRTSKSEAAQAIVDLFIQTGCEDIYESVGLVDAARVSILDDDSVLSDFGDGKEVYNET